MRCCLSAMLATKYWLYQLLICLGNASFQLLERLQHLDTLAMCRTCWETCICLWQSLQSIFVASAGNIVTTGNMCLFYTIPFSDWVADYSSFESASRVHPSQYPACAGFLTRGCYPDMSCPKWDIGPLFQHFVAYVEKGFPCMCNSVKIVQVLSRLTGQGNVTCKLQRAQLFSIYL